MTPEEKEKQEKWDLMETFLYAYISQPPDEIWNDEKSREEWEWMHPLLGWDVFQTNFKEIYAQHGKNSLITLSLKHAKEYYEQRAIGATTAPYEAIKGYAERVEKERWDRRNPKPIVVPAPKGKKRR